MLTNRRLSVAVLGLAVAACALLPVPALAASKPNVTVPSALLMTMDGRVLWSRQPDTERRVASTIKMLNALVVREHANLDDTVIVSAKAAKTADGVGLVKGQRLTVRQLLQMMLVASANDAAEAIAIHIGGTEANYVKLMNAKAKSLGLAHTHTRDPHGLGKKEHSTARDLSVLARTVMADPVLRKIVLMKKVSVPRPHKKPVSVDSTDQLLGHYAGIEGVKTGFTNPAGYCFVGAAKRGRIELLSVVLGAKTLKARFSESRKLLNWGFDGFKVKTVVSATATMGVVRVRDGVAASDPVHASRDATALVWTHQPVTTSITLPVEVSAPVHRGDQLGVVRAVQGTKTLAAVALLAGADVARAAPSPSSQVSSAGVARTFLQRLWAAVSAGLAWGRVAGSS